MQFVIKKDILVIVIQQLQDLVVVVAVVVVAVVVVAVLTVNLDQVHLLIPVPFPPPTLQNQSPYQYFGYFGNEWNHHR